MPQDALDGEATAIKTESDELETGAIVGIAIGAAAGVGLAAVAAYLCYRESRKGSSASLAKSTPVEMQVSTTSDVTLTAGKDPADEKL